MEQYFLGLAIKEAEKAADKGEVPVGAVIVKDNMVIAKARNMKENLKDVTAHAEILVIKKASEKLNNWRLNGCEMYVTLEPCAMCAAAICQSRISKIYIGTFDPIAGACGSITNLVQNENLGYNVNVKWLYSKECSDLLSDFFKLRRVKNLEVKWFKGSRDLKAGLELRKKVFVGEQDVPEDMEIDEFDKDCDHIVIYRGKTAAAVGRIVFDNGKCFFGRIAVAKEYRGTGLGKFLVEEMLKKAVKDGIKEVFIHAQVYAQGFYERIGFKSYGEKFNDAGIEHISMSIQI